MVEIRIKKHVSAGNREVAQNDDKKTKIAVAGAVIAAASAAVALARHLLQEQKFRRMPVFVLKADNGTEAHIRPLGCCIQRMLLPASPASAGLDSLAICYAAQACWCLTPMEHWKMSSWDLMT